MEPKNQDRMTITTNNFKPILHSILFTDIITRRLSTAVEIAGVAVSSSSPNAFVNHVSYISGNTITDTNDWF